MKLYDYAASGNCHKVRMLLAFLDLPYERIPVDIRQNASQTPAFRRLNPRGQVPVLVDQELTLWDSQAILTYLARRYGDEGWLPLAAEPMARVMGWMALAQNEILYGLARARLVLKMGRGFDLAECQAMGSAALQVLESHLADHPWLATERVTIADLACYPYVALVPEAGLDLAPYPAVCAWVGRIQGLPGYVGMPGMAQVPIVA